MALHLITGYSGKEHITSADAGSFNISTLGEGQYVLNHGECFRAEILGTNVIEIFDGDLIMQGRHVRLASGEIEEVTVTNGTQGKLRHDLVVMRYTKDAESGIESVALVVLEGTEAVSNPQDPEIISGNITDGTDLINDFPLYRVRLIGRNVQPPEPLFKVNNEGIYALLSKDFILQNKAELAFYGKICTIEDTRITADTLVDVYFTADTIETAGKADISVETINGAIKLTAENEPEGTIKASIKVRVI